MNYFNANGKYPNGKYQFNDFATISICNKFNNGACISGINYKFKKGDVIDVTNQSLNDNIHEWQAQLPTPEQITTVPFSILTKVDDSTPVTTTFEKSTYTTNPEDYQPIYTGGGIPDEEKVSNKKSDCGTLGIGGLFQFHCWKKDAQVAAIIGVLSFAGYGVYNKKTPLAIAGLGLLGGLSGLIVTSIKPKK